MEDEYLRERKPTSAVKLTDHRPVCASAAGIAASPLSARDFVGEDPLLLVANDIAPADLLQFKKSVFTGFVTDVGGRTSHTAIVARSMDIPAVVGAREASRLIRQDDWVVVDGDAGIVVVNPSCCARGVSIRQRQGEVETRLPDSGTRRP
jgi:phosphotransferase system enzyme I (PtsI)